MSKKVKRMVTVKPLVNWCMVELMESKGHKFKSWKEYPTVTPGAFEFTAVRKRSTTMDHVSTIE